MCVGVFLPLALGHNPTHSETLRSESDIYPTMSALRALQRLFGDRSNELYNFKNPVTRELQEDDVSSLLFQDHVELQPKFRTQFLLSSRKRETMAKTLVSTAPSFILPSIFSMLDFQLDKITSDTVPPLFTSEQVQTLKKLQQYQQVAAEHAREVYQSYVYYLEGAQLSSESPAHAMLRDNTGHREKLQQLATLDLFTSPVGAVSPLLSSNYATGSGAYKAPLLQSIDSLDVSMLPVILQSPQQSIIAQEKISWTSHDESVLQQLQQHPGVEMSRMLLIQSLTSIGSHFYLEDDKTYMFWRLYFQHTISPSLRDTMTNLHHNVHQLRHGGDDNSPVLHSHLITLGDSLQQTLAHDAFDWFTGYELGALPSPQLFGQSGANIEHLTKEVQANGQVTAILPDVERFQDYIGNMVKSIPNEFLSAVFFPHASSHSSEDGDVQLVKDPQNKILGHMKQLFSSSQGSLPKLQLINRYSQPFFLFPDQEELLLLNVDVEAIVKSSLITSLTSAYEQQYFKTVIRSTIERLFTQYEDDILQSVVKRFTRRFRVEIANYSTYTDDGVTSDHYYQDIMQHHVHQYLQTIKDMLVQAYTHDGVQQDFVQFIPQFPTFLEQVMKAQKNYLNLHAEELHLVNRVVDGVAAQLSGKPAHNESTDDKKDIYKTLSSLPVSKHGGVLSTRDLFQYTPNNEEVVKDNERFYRHASMKASDVTPPPDNNDEKCTQCKAEYSKKMDEVERTFPAQVEKFFEPLCRIVWPYIGPKIGDNLCDPLVKDECYTLCVGTVGAYKDAIGQLVAFMKYSPDRQCFKENKCPYDPTSDYPHMPEVSVQSDTVTPRRGRELWLHVTDQHLDLDYVVGETNVDCKMPVCCFTRDYAEAEMIAYEQGRDTVDDVDVGRNWPSSGDAVTVKRAREYGEYSCDTPYKLLTSMAERLAIHCPTIVFTTGDFPAHDLWKQTKEANIATIRNVTSTMISGLELCGDGFYREYQAFNIRQFAQSKQNGDQLTQAEQEEVTRHHHTLRERAGVSLEQDEQFKKHLASMSPQELEELTTLSPLFDDALDIDHDTSSTPAHLKDYPRVRFFPAIGNHAAAPVNQFSGYPIYDDWLLKVLADIWSQDLTSHGKTALQYGGYFHREIGPNLSVISLHTGLYDQHNPWRLLDLTHWDPSSQLKWLETNLEQLKQQNSKVVLMMHEPLRSLIPGAAKNKLHEIYHTYRDTIHMVLAGHVHSDNTWLLYDTLQQELHTMPTVPEWLIAKATMTTADSSSASLADAADATDVLDATGVDVEITVDDKKPLIATTSNDDYIARYPFKQGHFAYHYLETIARQHLIRYLDANNAGASFFVNQYLQNESILPRHRQNKLDLSKGDADGAETTISLDTLDQLSEQGFDPEKHPWYALTPIGIELLPSSLTPLEYSTNPSYRVFTYDRATATTTGFSQYRLLIDDQPSFSGSADEDSRTPLVKGAHWFMAYGSRQTYGLESIVPQEYHKLAFRMATNATLSQMYHANTFGGVTSKQHPDQESWTPFEAACQILSYSKLRFEECMDGWQ